MLCASQYSTVCVVRLSGDRSTVIVFLFSLFFLTLTCRIVFHCRRLYFNFTYFMFFYNIFLGLVSCLLRILKAMFVGIVFLSRLDNSTLPRRFEFIDPGRSGDRVGRSGESGK